MLWTCEWKVITVLMEKDKKSKTFKKKREFDRLIEVWLWEKKLRNYRWCFFAAFYIIIARNQAKKTNQRSGWCLYNDQLSCADYFRMLYIVRIVYDWLILYEWFVKDDELLIESWIIYSICLFLFWSAINCWMEI